MQDGQDSNKRGNRHTYVLMAGTKCVPQTHTSNP